jgi:hypothetical protein
MQWAEAATVGPSWTMSSSLDFVDELGEATRMVGDISNLMNDDIFEADSPES